MRTHALSGLMICATMTAFAQEEVEVKGRVVDVLDGMSIPGVTILVQGSSVGTITDYDGNFVLQAPKESVIVISCIGYKNQEFIVGSQDFFNVSMKEDTEALEEVVVVGYGVQKKSVVTASISRVTAEQLNTTRPSRVEDALKGKVSGVQITQSSGQPGSDSKVRIRGIGTVNNSEPLYIVDGMPVDGGINYLNPTDIASVEVLKDAASAAIYGARAANGVILVTTKGGTEGRTTVSYDFS